MSRYLIYEYIPTHKERSSNIHKQRDFRNKILVSGAKCQCMFGIKPQVYVMTDLIVILLSHSTQGQKTSVGPTLTPPQFNVRCGIRQLHQTEIN